MRRLTTLATLAILALAMLATPADAGHGCARGARAHARGHGPLARLFARRANAGAACAYPEGYAYRGRAHYTVPTAPIRAAQPAPQQKAHPAQKAPADRPPTLRKSSSSSSDPGSRIITRRQPEDLELELEPEPTPQRRLSDRTPQTTVAPDPLPADFEIKL